MQAVSKMLFPRCFTAVVTPFTEDNKIDIPSFHNVVAHSLKHNVGVVIFGTTGETPTLSYEEKTEMLQFIKTIEIPASHIVIGVGGNNTSECIEMMDLAVSNGFTNIMVTTPYYNKPSQTGVYMHFKTISDALAKLTADGRIIMYNVPTRTNVNLLPETVKRICSECPNIIALKEASGDLNQMLQIRKLVPDLALYSGDDGLVVPVISIGGVGLISVLSNAYPKEVNEIIGLCLDGNYSTALTKYFAVHDTIKLLFSEPNPTPIKYMLYKMGLINTPRVRLPLIELENKDVVKKLYDFCSTFDGDLC